MRERILKSDGHGNWKEPPNFFNPVWKGRLVPVREHWEFGQFAGSTNMCTSPAVRAMLPADWLDVLCSPGNSSAAAVVIH